MSEVVTEVMKSVVPYSQFTQHLQEELVKRIERNPSYSARAFAQALEVDPSLFGKILRGERPVSKALFHKLSRKLLLSSEEQQFFAQEMGQKYLSEITGQRSGYTPVAAKDAEILGHWHYHALLELIRIPKFDLQPRNISKALGIGNAEASLALNKLIKLKMIKKDSRGNWLRCQDNINTYVQSVDSQVAKRLQQQWLERAIAALKEVPIEQRDQTAIAMAVDRNLMGKIKNEIKEFRRSLSIRFQKIGKPNEVYLLSVSFFPLTHLEKQRTKHA